MVEFINSFLSYLLLMVIIAALAGVGTFIGITLRKKKNAKEAAATPETMDEAVAENIETSEDK